MATKPPTSISIPLPPWHIVGFRQIQRCPRGHHRDGRQCRVQGAHQQRGQALAAVPIVGFGAAEPWGKNAGKWKGFYGLGGLFLSFLFSGNWQ